MKKAIRISATLARSADTDDLCCAQCGQALELEAGQHWKDAVPSSRTPVASLPGWSTSIHPDLELRQFFCPSCAGLLDTEVALPEDPFLYDVVQVHAN